MRPSELLRNITEDIRVDLTEEFDRNFERKSFFGKAWKTTKLPNARGSLLMRSGALRRSIRSRIQSGQITWSSSLPYASLQNNGGEIVVTEKMKKFFWAMYYKSAGAISTKKSGEAIKNQRNQRLSAEAQQWKNLALMKTGHKMKIEQRQFIGDHPIVRERVEKIIDSNIKEFADSLFKQMKKR